MFTLRRKNFKKIDKALFFSFILLIIYGLFVLNSASNSLNDNHLIKQILSTLIGVVISAVILTIDMNYLKKLAIPIYLFCNILLVLVLFFGVGEDWGARAWFSIGGFNFQPAELAKLGITISLATWIEKSKANINEPKTLIRILILAGIPIILILRQPDFGTAMVFSGMVVVMLFCAGIHFKYIISAMIGLLVSLPFAYMLLGEYQKERIKNFLNPERDISNTGWQAIQGKTAIGSGKIFGEGYLKGVQTQYNFIPEKQTDYIFSVLVEELGLIGGAVLIGLYSVLIQRIVVLAYKENSLYNRLILISFAAMFLIHIFENIGMTIGLMPITGIPLPFFSYGGTFQIINMMAIAIILSITIQKDPLSFI